MQHNELIIFYTGRNFLGDQSKSHQRVEAQRTQKQTGEYSQLTKRNLDSNQENILASPWQPRGADSAQILADHLLVLEAPRMAVLGDWTSSPANEGGLHTDPKLIRFSV